MALLHLNIVIRLDPVFGGAESDGNTRYVATVFPDLGLENSLILVAKRPKLELLLPAGAKPLNAEDTTLDRSVTTRVNNLSMDRPGGHMWNALDQAWERGAEHNSTNQWRV